jgi:hypothetical protein
MVDELVKEFKRSGAFDELREQLESEVLLSKVSHD